MPELFRQDRKRGRSIAGSGILGCEFNAADTDRSVRKAKAVKAVVSGPVTPECPGSILQMHPDCILVADEEALSLL